ncbi:MAG TPA: MFS transporter [Solirubrobacteraceae bacterium]|jgi:MFS family permease|nr:MFS transporter [Solirubrobacteraceae bacterium]
MATATASADQLGTIETNIPARLDRLPWSRWHWRILIGLGTVWILDGLEVTIVGSIAGAISAKGSGIDISSAQVAGWAASMYVAGACFGALLFGRLTDMFGRKRLFMVTLGVYLAATIATAFAWTPLFFFACRFVTGMGIGGEYSAINSAIDELIPAEHRGRTDILINGTYWAGAAAGALLSVAALHIFSPLLQWRVCFGLGFILGLAILIVRRHVPESPRWLFIHGREEEAEAVTRDIERQVRESTGEPLTDPDPDDTICIRQRKSISLWEITRAIVSTYPKRTVLGLALFIGQAFLYNAILFGYATLLSTFFGVATSNAPYYLVAFAVGNLLGPLVLGPLFDSVGRKPMIAGTYILSGVLLLITGYLFDQHQLTAATLTIAWSVVFFFASAGVSAAYLTVSEIFPMETRALAIAVFYAVGTGIGGIIGPQLFGRLVPTGKTSDVFVALAIGAVLMILGGVAEIVFGVKAERRRLEGIATPLTAVGAAVRTGASRARRSRPAHAAS